MDSQNNSMPLEIPPEHWPRLWQASRRIMQPLAARDSRSAWQALAEAFCTLLNARQGRIYRLSARKAGRLVCQALHPAGDHASGAEIPLEALPFAAEDKVCLLAGESLRDFPGVASGANNALAVALCDGEGKIQGLMVAENKDRGAAGFDEADARLAVALAAPARAAVLALRARESAMAETQLLRERFDQVTAAFGLANAELARAARVSDQFLANMSHELRTPLNTILGMSQALQEGVMGPITDDQMNYLQMVEKAGRHLLTMLTDILTLSKAGAGRLDVTPGPVATQALCQECMHFVIQPARQKHMKVEMKCDPRAAVFEADENILKQILVNLLTNAVKFTEERGTLALEVKVEPEREAIEFCVADTGVGIAPENLGRLFQPFVQLNDGLTRSYPGTGLGLSLVYKLAELHGGSVRVASALGKGSQFTVRLAWQEEPVPPPPGGVPPEAPRILVVDDNEISIQRLTACLEAGGYAVTVARQGAEALERAAEEKPAGMLVDLQLAGMNGWAVIRHLRENSKMMDVPIAGTTAMVIPGDREKCLAAGAAEYLIKPVCRADLLAAVARLVKSTAEPAAHSKPAA